MPITRPPGNLVPLPLLAARQVRPGNLVPLPFGLPPAPQPEVVGALAAASGARWGGLVPRLHSVRTLAAPVAPALQRLRASWGGLAQHRRGSSGVWGGLGPRRSTHQAAWQPSTAGARRSLHAPWSSNPIISRTAQDQWAGSGLPLRRAQALPWRVPPLIGRAADPRWGGLLAQQRTAMAPWTVPPKFEAVKERIPWGYGRGLQWVVRPPPPPPVPDPPPKPGKDGRRVPLAFVCGRTAALFPADRIPLRIGFPGCFNARLVARAFVVLNEIEVVRLPDLLPIAVDAVSLVSSRDTWCWDAQLQLADPAQLAAVQPTAAGPRQLRITINGYQWVIAVESFGRGREFGQARVDIAGRSVTAQLSEPYAPARSAEVSATRTMQQLAEAEVDGTDVTVQYDSVDWLVPGGAWYYDSQTPMSAMLRIAAAAGAVVQSDPALPRVRIAPRYPVSPWDWTTTAPDVQIQDDIVTGERLQLQSRPAFDAVIVAGEKVGVAARVIREGEAGQTYAPQQVDQLITHADGARERGRNVLADRGGQAAVEHDIPLFPAPLATGQPGLVLPLQLARRITAEGTWHGLATAVRITATRQGPAVDVVQTVTLERHYTDAD